jgi:hypothetical protein
MKRFAWALTKYLAYLASLALVLFIGLYVFVKLKRGPSIYDLLAQDIQSMEIRCHDFNVNTSDICLCSDQAAIGSFLQLIHQGEPARRHMCASPVDITIRLHSGTEVRFWAQPGHDAEFYEISHFDLRRVKRSEFMRVAKQLGIKKVPELCP